jgi:DNA polymerase III alpha subunit
MSDTYPKKFVGLHSHDHFSTFDAIGTPKEHIDFAIENGMDALANTNHGNANSFAQQYNYNQELKKKGIPFKAIYGIEAYYIPSIDDWRKLKDDRDTLKKQEVPPGEQFTELKEELDEVVSEKENDSDEDGGTIIENESETKTAKYSDPIKDRSHLVLLAKNNEGLKAIFQLTSLSAAKGFYIYPRIDLNMIRQYAKGNVISTSACLGGKTAKTVYKFLPNIPWEEWNVNELKDYKFNEIQDALKQEIEQFQDAFGKENYYLELQINKLNAQHLVNYHLIEASKRTGAQLVVTCDSHYSRPEHWREREIYKAIGWQQRGITDFNLPKTIDELKCELYPKNASQVWDSYIKYGKSQYDFYDDTIIKDAIERTYNIAHYQIDKDISVDKKVKLPSIKKLVEPNRLEQMFNELGEDDEDTIAFKELKRLSLLGMVKRKLDHKQNYINQLKYELEVIKELKFSKYFLTYYKIMELTSKKMLSGQGRGSAAASLLAYVLYITQVDPIKYGLLFERFLSKKKRCQNPLNYTISNQGIKQLKDLTQQDALLTHNNRFKSIIDVWKEKHINLIEIETEDGQILKCSSNHKWIVMRNGQRIQVEANKIELTDELIEN